MKSRVSLIACALLTGATCHAQTAVADEKVSAVNEGGLPAGPINIVPSVDDVIYEKIQPPAVTQAMPATPPVAPAVEPAAAPKEAVVEKPLPAPRKVATHKHHHHRRHRPHNATVAANAHRKLKHPRHHVAAVAKKPKLIAKHHVVTHRRQPVVAAPPARSTSSATSTSVNDTPVRPQVVTPPPAPARYAPMILSETDEVKIVDQTAAEQAQWNREADRPMADRQATNATDRTIENRRAVAAPVVAVTPGVEQGDRYLAIDFLMGSDHLSERAKQDIRTMIDRVKAQGQISKVDVAAWSDQAYPSAGTHLSREDVKLAKRRLAAVDQFLKSEMNVRGISNFNMAKRANWFERVVRNKDAQLKSLYAKSAAPLRNQDLAIVKNEGGPAKVVVLLEEKSLRESPRGAAIQKVEDASASGSTSSPEERDRR